MQHDQTLGNAAKAIRLIKEQLPLFGRKLSNNVVVTVAGVASLMAKLGKDTFPEHMICYDHAIYLAIYNVLYKKYSTSRVKISFGLKNNCESDTENDFMLKLKMILRR